MMNVTYRADVWRYKNLATGRKLYAAALVIDGVGARVSKRRWGAKSKALAYGNLLAERYRRRFCEATADGDSGRPA